MKKMISIILLALLLVGCNEVKMETSRQVTETVQTEELHDELYKKIKFHSCKADLFEFILKRDETYKVFNKSDREDFEDVANSIPESQDTLAILYACDKLIK